VKLLELRSAPWHRQERDTRCAMLWAQAEPPCCLLLLAAAAAMRYTHGL
jgi:hypothetical protein